MDADDYHGTKAIGWWWGLPRWWWFLVIVVAAASGVFLWTRGITTCPGWQSMPARMVPQGRWVFLLGIYVFFIFAGHIVIQFIQRMFDVLTTLELTGADRDRALDRPNNFPVAFVGFVEGVLYPTSLLADVPEVIAAWIVLKVAGQWKTWEAGHPGRRTFNRFLFGSGISFGVGTLTYLGVRIFALC